MIERLAQALREFTDKQAGVGPYLTEIDGVGILRSDHPKPPLHMITRPSLCIVAQGAKWASFGDTRMEYRAGQALLIGVDTPTSGRVSMASPDAPCLVLALELDLAMLRDVLAKMPASASPALSRKGGPGAVVIDIDVRLAECALRLVHLLDTPDAIATVHPLIVQEICYWLLTGPQGPLIASLALNNASHGIVSALHALRQDYQKNIRVEELAQVARMSVSVFHRQFKALTSYSPLQYLKRVRLLEARRQMVAKTSTIQAIAYDVGYESASQFSREYARMFGDPPKRDRRRLTAEQPSD